MRALLAIVPVWGLSLAVSVPAGGQQAASAAPEAAGLEVAGFEDYLNVRTTRDFLWAPEEPGERTLRIDTTFDQGLAAFPREAPPPHTMDISVRVR